MILTASIFVSLTFALVAYLVFAPLPKLSKRLSPWDSVAKVRLLGTFGGPEQLAAKNQGSLGFVFEFFRPIYDSLAKAVAKIANLDNEEALAIKLAQAGVKTTVTQYKISLVKKVVFALLIGFVLGSATGNVAGLIFCPAILSFIMFTKTQAGLDKAIEQRRQTIRLELYTINQLLALHVRTGAGVSQALSRISLRTNGIIADEISDVLNRVRSGTSIEDSLYIASKSTAEPHAKRAFNLLAAASHRGVDLTQGLLDLAKDLRRTLREDVKATSAKRRAAMLLPTIGLLAPIMLLFVAAPIPSIVLGGR